MNSVQPSLKRLGALLVAATLAVALAVAAHGPSEALSAKERKEVLEKAWKEINDHYYDPAFNGVNWAAVREKYLPMVEAVNDDERFYSVMSRMTGELHDAHTRFSSPKQWENRKKQQGVAVGMRVGYVEGKVAIVDVLAGASAAQAGIEPGMIVATVDGRPVEQRIAEVGQKATPSSSERITRLLILRSVFTGPLEAPLALGLERADGSKFEAKLTRQVISTEPHVTAKRLDSGLAYLRFDEFRSPVAKEFKEELEKDHAATGMVLDLRRNGGGEGNAMAAMAGYFFPRRTLLAKIMHRKQVAKSERAGGNEEQSDAYAGKEGQQIYAGPVVILMSESSGSAAELFAAGLQDAGRAKIAGGQSCGCVLGITKHRVMKGGGVLEISEILWFSPKGRKLEGEGVIPDKAVALTIASLREKRDVVLDEGVKMLQEMAATKAAPSGR
jgi:carboxyl-terminal processing protease